MSLFNNTDPANPVEISDLTIGEEWAVGEAAQKHKAIMITPLDGVFGKPVAIYETVTFT